MKYWMVFGTWSLVLLLHLVAAFTSTPLLWGVDAWRYYSFPVQLILVALTIGVLLPGGRAILESAWDDALGLLERHARSVPVPLTMAISGMIAVVVLIYWQSAVHFLGDGYIRIRDLANGLMFNVREPLDSLIHAGIYTALGRGGLDQAAWSFVLVSVVSGVAFVALTIPAMRVIESSLQGRMLLGALILLTGASQVFFGYVENYSILMVLMLAYVTAGLRATSPEQTPVLPTALFMFALFVHTSAIIWFPSLAYLWWLYFRHKAPVRSRVFAVTAAFVTVTTALVLGLVVLSEFGFTIGNVYNEFILKDHWLRLWEHGDPIEKPYALFSWLHLSDIVNEVLLIAPAAVVLPLLFTCGRSFLRAESRHRFLGWLLLFFGLIAVAFDMKRGYSRDWDLLAAAAIPVTVFAYSLIRHQFPAAWRPVGMLLLILSVLHTLPWTGVNADRSHAIARFKNMITHSGWSARAHGDALDELRQYYWEHDDLARAVTYAKEAFEIMPLERYRDNLTGMYINSAVERRAMGEIDAALELYQEALRIDPTRMVTYLNMGTVFEREGAYEKALEIYGRALGVDSTDARIHYNIGVTRQLQGENDRARYAYEKAVLLNPYMPEAYLALGALYETMGEHSRARALLATGTGILPRDARLRSQLGVLCIQDRDFAFALREFQTEIRLDPSFTAHYNLATTYMLMDSTRQAIGAYLQAAAMEPNHKDLQYNLALAYALAGEYESTRRHAQKAAELGEARAEQLLQRLQAPEFAPR